MATIQIYGTLPGGGGGGGETVIANPELDGTEDALTGLQVGDTKYKVTKVTLSTTDLTPGVSELAEGELYFVYE